MINQAQMEFLDTLIGDEGCYTETIKNYPDVDMGTKVLYLKRAISEDKESFLHFLDKLYQPVLIGEAEKANLEFVNALKTINDLHFNHLIRFGVFGQKSALTHFFGALGDKLIPSEYQQAIASIINIHIQALRAQHSLEIEAQILTRCAAEAHIIKHNAWRLEGMKELKEILERAIKENSRYTAISGLISGLLALATIFFFPTYSLPGLTLAGIALATELIALAYYYQRHIFAAEDLIQQCNQFATYTKLLGLIMKISCVAVVMLAMFALNATAYTVLAPGFWIDGGFRYGIGHSFFSKPRLRHYLLEESQNPEPGIHTHAVA
jgi:hypothetical protein